MWLQTTVRNAHLFDDSLTNAAESIGTAVPMQHHRLRKYQLIRNATFSCISQHQPSQEMEFLVIPIDGEMRCALHALVEFFAVPKVS